MLEQQLDLETAIVALDALERRSDRRFRSFKQLQAKVRTANQRARYVVTLIIEVRFEENLIKSRIIEAERQAAPPAPVVIRRVGPGDEAVFERVAADVFDEPVDPGRLRAYLAEPNHLMVLALRADKVVGKVAAVIHRHPDKPTELYIDELGVTPALQRQGIGRRMLDAMLALGRDLGCEEAWVGTEPDNLAARGLYESYDVTAETFVMYLTKL